MGGDRAPPALSGNGAGRGLHDRFPDGLCRAAVLEVPRPADRRPAAARICYCLLRHALPPLRRDVRAQRERRRGQACAARHRATSTSSRSASSSASSGPTGATRELRAKLGLADDQPLLIYVGRLDGEKKPDVVVDAFRRLPRELGAKLALIGEGPLRDRDRGAWRRAHHHARLCEGPRRARALAGERRHLCLGHGRRDLRRVDHRGPGFGPAGRRRGRRAR